MAVAAVAAVVTAMATEGGEGGGGRGEAPKRPPLHQSLNASPGHSVINIPPWKEYQS